MTYNTEDLYGKVEASWKMAVEPRKGATPGESAVPALLRALQGRPPAKAAYQIKNAPAKETERVPDKKPVD